jgi:ABC-type glycerol-3-phosphate transport system substrate-binding protein
MKASRVGDRSSSAAGVTARPSRRAVRAAALVAVVALAVAACGGSSSPSKDSAQGSDNKKVTLKINFWGDFGFKQLAPEYKKLHPNVTLVLNAGDYNQQHQDLQKLSLRSTRVSSSRSATRPTSS